MNKLETYIFGILTFSFLIARPLGNFLIPSEKSTFCSHSLCVSRCKPRIFIQNTFCKLIVEKTFIVYILPASSVHHAIDALSPELQSKCKDKVFAIPSLCLNPYTINPRKIVQLLLLTNLKDKTEIVVWRDVLNISICRHRSNNYRPLSVPDLINVLKTPQNKLSGLVFCLRGRTPDIFDSRREIEKGNSNQVFSIVKDSISVRRQNNPDLLNQLKPLHQSLELKNIDFILRKENNFSSFIS